MCNIVNTKFPTVKALPDELYILFYEPFFCTVQFRGFENTLFKTLFPFNEFKMLKFAFVPFRTEVCFNFNLA